MKRYIVDGNVTDTRHVVGFASERLFVDYTDHAALLRAVAGDVRTLNHQHNCSAQLCAKCGWRNGGPRHDDTLASSHGFEYHEFEVGACNCPRGKVLAMLEVE